ncbi:MAG: YhbY family RNA-binding protein [Candidatus Woesearchaeota archaeon]|nr:YhbY family RNA-binding protein [Candidatus Woesearchaeota archaeon]
MDELKKRIKEKAKAIPIVVRIGKMGVTKELLSEIERHLNKKGIVKVKMLNNFTGEHDRFETAGEIAEKTGSTLIDVKGFVIILYKFG